MRSSASEVKGKGKVRGEEREEGGEGRGEAEQCVVLMYPPSGIMSLISFIACLSLLCILASALTASRLLCRAKREVSPLMHACTNSLSVDRSAPLLNMRRSSRPPEQ